MECPPLNRFDAIHLLVNVLLDCPYSIGKTLLKFTPKSTTGGLLKIRQAFCRSYGLFLGKAQRLLKHLNPNIGPIYTHSSITAMTEVTSAQVDFPKT